MIRVDEIRKYPGAKPPFNRGSCHLTADDEEELVAFGAKMGLARRHLHRAGEVHFDLTPAKRIEALRLGAVFEPAQVTARRRLDARSRTERRPVTGGWSRELVPASIARDALASSAWTRGGVFVISTLVLAKLPAGDGVGKQWHLSLSRVGRRPSAADVRRVRTDFRLHNAETDNHHPGVAVHLWQPLAWNARVVCECKAGEALVVEADGYTWSNDQAGPCRGCEFASLVAGECPLHGRPG